jgi:hypothetical protein
LKERTGRKVVNLSFITDVERSSLLAVKALKFLEGEGFQILPRRFDFDFWSFQGPRSFFEFYFGFGNAKLVLCQMVPGSLHNVESLVEPFEHLMGGPKPQPPAVEFNTVTDDVNKAEPFPLEGFSNAGSEMVEMIDRSSGIEIGDLMGQDATQSQRRVRYSSGRRDRLRPFRSGRSSLSACESIDLIVIAEDGDVRVSSGGVEQMIPTDARKIAVTGKDDDVQIRTNGLDRFGSGQGPAMRRVDRIKIHIARHPA